MAPKGSSTKKSSKPLNWTQEGEALLSKYLAKAKASKKAFVIVLGTGPGEIVLLKNQGFERDWVSLASMLVAFDASNQQLHQLLGVKASQVYQAGDFWVEKAASRIIAGFQVKYMASELKQIVKHLKKSDGGKKTGGDSALKSLMANEAMIDRTLTSPWESS